MHVVHMAGCIIDVQLTTRDGNQMVMFDVIFLMHSNNSIQF